MATVPDLKDQVTQMKAQLGRLILNRPIRDPLAHLHPDLTGPQIHVIVCLSMASRPMAMADLAEQVCASAPTMTGLVDRLERQGLLARTRDEQDRRVVLIQLTPSGAEAAAALDKDASTKIAGLLAGLDSKDRETFVTLFTRIVDNLIVDGAAAEDEGAAAPPSEEAES